MENENQNPIVTTTPVQEVQTVQPAMQVQPVQPKKRHIMRNILMVLGIAVLGAVGYIGYTNPTLFSASITGGTSQPSSPTNLYIPTDYKSSAGESGYVELAAGSAMTAVSSIDMTLSFDKNKVSLLTAERSSALTTGVVAGVPAGEGKFRVTLTFSPSKDLAINDKLIKIKAPIKLNKLT